MEHLENLKEYIKNDFTYNRYRENPTTYYGNTEMIIINHCKDIEWLISEIEALYELTKEMKDKK